MSTHLITPPEDQGQIVVVSYALCYDVVIQRWLDQSDGQIIWSKSRALKNDEGDYWNGGPSNKRWTRISAEEADKILSGDDD